jgi:hypothetical protein
MAKQENEPLFRLIHSLSKSEKRLFKIYANRLSNTETNDKKFILLFNSIATRKKNTMNKKY